MKKLTRVVRPGRRKPLASTSPSQASTAFPIADYIVPPADAKGRSVSISLTLPPQMRRVSSVVLQHRVLPFETEQDLMRWCVHHGLELLARMSKDAEVTSEYSAMANWLAVARKESEGIVYQAHLDAVLLSVDGLIDSGHTDKAIALAEMVWKQSDRLEDPHWCEHYRSVAKNAMDRARRKRRSKRRGGRKGEGEGEGEPHAD